MTAVVIALISFVLMEPFTAFAHRVVMHGIGHSLHHSHHRNHHQKRRNRQNQTSSRWEANDAFPVMFASVVMIGFAIGFNVAGFAVLVPIGIGITAYGAAYALVHDVYVHRRLSLFGDRTVPVFERLAVAHRRHHDRNGAPYGMLMPLPVRSTRSGSTRTGSNDQSGRNGSRPSHDPTER